MAAVRRALFAGRFYPADPDECRAMAARLLDPVDVPAAMGAIAPHAGWIYSGSTAAMSIRAIANHAPETVVVFGAVHGPDRNVASVYPYGAWETPLGPVAVDEGLAARLLGAPGAVANPDGHRFEHSIEVQLPLLRYLLPEVQVVPIGVPPTAAAPEFGAAAARELTHGGRCVAYLATSDLTHYGPAFGFEPAGSGPEGVHWAKAVNDRRFISLVADLDAGAVVAEASQHENACGSGAVAALLGAMRELGLTQFMELAHTCSAEMKIGGARDDRNSVGYLAGVFLPA